LLVVYVKDNYFYREYLEAEVESSVCIDLKRSERFKYLVNKYYFIYIYIKYNATYKI